MQTAWGSPSLMDAAKALLKAALQEPSNQRFVLLCESSEAASPPRFSNHCRLSKTLPRPLDRRRDSVGSGSKSESGCRGFDLLLRATCR